MDATASRRAERGTRSGKSPEALRTISEVAQELDLPPHVLRFWETRFPQIKPMKRRGGHRLYRPSHVALLRGIRALLYDDGMSIKGAQKMLREKGAKAVIARGNTSAALEIRHPAPPADAAERLAALKERLKAQRGARVVKEGDPISAESIRENIARLEELLTQLQDA